MVRNMAKRNYSGDKEYQREVRARGGHRTEADYRRYKDRKNSFSSSYAIPKKMEDYIQWMNKENSYEGFFVIEKRITREQFEEIKETLVKIPFDKVCLIGNDKDYINYVEYSFLGIFDLVLFSFFFGYLGIDRFLLGQVGKGILKLITGGGAGIWWLIDIFRMPKLVRNKEAEKENEKYNKNFALLKSIVKLENQSKLLNDYIDRKIFEESEALLSDFNEPQRLLFNTGNSIKIETVKTNFNVNSDEIFFFAYDDTIRKNFKEGFLLTDKNLYFTADGKNIVLKIDEISELSLKNGAFSKFIIINKCKISITSLLSEDATVLFSFLQKTIEFIKNR